MRTPRRRLLDDQRGLVGLIGVLVYSIAILIIGTGLAASSVTNHRVSQQRIDSTQSLYNAEAGAEDALLQIKRNAAYGATTTTLVTTFDSRNRVETTVDTPGSAECASAKEVTASGYADELVRRIRLTNCPAPSVNADFVYAIQAGAGGISMSNNSTVNGTTYSNGSHIGGNNSRVTGDVVVAGGAAAVAAPSHDPVSPTEFIFGRSTAPNVIDAAQSFIADTSNSNKLIKVSLKVRKFGNPANATVRIVTDNADKPSSTQVATGTLNAASVGNTLQFIDVSMSSPPTLTNGQKYWIVIDSGSSSSNYWAWGSQDGYGGGKGMSSPQWKSSGSMTWNNTAADFAFSAFMGSPPTVAQGLTINGTVRANTIISNNVSGNAYFQTNSGSSVAGTSYPGSADSPQRDLPITNANIIDFQNQAASGTTYTGNYTVTNGASATLGPIKIIGDLNVSNNADIMLNGTVWVTGTINLSNNVEVRLAPGYGATSGTIVSDGPINISNNADFYGSGQTNSFLLLLTSSASSAAINNANNAASIILAAPNGTIVISNNGGANALAANRLELSNNASINYLSGLADVNFSAGPGGSFQAGGWQEIILD